MKKKNELIPVFDLCSFFKAVEITPLHHDVIAGPINDYQKFRPNMVLAHRHTFYHVVLFTSGKGKQVIDFEEFDMHPGQIYFMSPGQVHYWDFTGDIEGYLINFSENIFLSFISNPLYLEQFPFFRGIPKDSVLELKGKGLSEAVYFIGQVINEVGKKDSFSMDMVCFDLMALFISISRNCPTAVNRQIPDQKQMTLLNYRQLVNQHFRDKRLPRDYAALLFITPGYLNNLCMELTGIPAGQIIRDRILLEAKRMLINLDSSIAEIAYQLNFTDSSYFSRFFKKYTRSSPDEFRKTPVSHRSGN